VSPESRFEEVTLEQVQRRLIHDRASIVLRTAPGPETDLLTVALARRLEGAADVMRMAAHRVDGDELFRQLLRRLGLSPSPDPESQLLLSLRVRAQRGSPLVLLIRGADGVPHETLRQLGRLAAGSERGLRLGLVIEADLDAGPGVRMGPILGLDVETVTVGAARSRELVGLQDSTVGGRRRPRKPLRTAGVAAAGLIALGLAGVAAGRWDIPARAGRGWDVSAPPAAPTPLIEQTAPTMPTGSGLAAGAAIDAAPSDAPRPPFPVATVARATIDLEPEMPESGPEPLAGNLGERPGSDPLPDVSAAGSAEASAASAPPPAPVARARLSINARPWARIELDGRVLGTTPLADLPVEPGSYVVRAVLPDGRRVERALRVGTRDVYIAFP
jgi:hypothetical protein